MFKKTTIGVWVVALCVAQASLGTGSEPELVGWWKLDETSGSIAADSSGNNLRGFLRNGPPWTQGVNKGALAFDGRDDYVAISGVYYGRTANTEVTVATWVRTTNGDDQIIFSFDRSDYWRLEINGAAADTGQIGWGVATDAGVVDLASRTRIDDGQWHHIAAIFDHGGLMLYIDGRVDATTRFGNTFGSGTPRFGFLGVGSEAETFDGTKAPENYLQGALDDVYFFTRALTPTEIAQLAAHEDNNDDCDNALPIKEVANLPFDTRQATHDGLGIVMRSPNLWYVYTPSCTGIATVSLCGSGYDTMLAVYEGETCPPTGKELIVFNDDFCQLQSQVMLEVAAGRPYLIEVGGYGTASGQGVLTITCEANAVAEFDLGDAPDSDGVRSTRMTAYVGGPTGVVDAHFPTLFSDADGQPNGPIHLHPLAVAHLGETVSLETGADAGPDEDGVNNIDPADDLANQDGNDDGVVFPIAMPQCGWASFDYLVNVIDPNEDLWVNVWIDFNRDGDWDDDTSTDPVMGDGQRYVSEWAVRNQLLFDLPAGLHQISAPGFLSWHPEKGPQEVWMRITLSEKPYRGGDNPGLTGNAGSGPAEGFEIGETEDYFFVPEADCLLCEDLNGDGEIDFNDLIELMYTWLDTCQK